MAPDIRAAIPKVKVRGKTIWLGVERPKVWINGWVMGSLNIRSGAVRTARNGSTAPILRISANEAAIIKTSRIANWDRRRFDI